MTRINYTGRQRINRDDVRLRLRNAGGNLLLDVLSLNTQELDLPSDAVIVVEAYRQTGYMRFDGGPVGAPSLPQAQPLTEFVSPEGLLFRVKVVGVDGSDNGKLLAAADRLRPLLEDEQTTQSESLLPIRPERMGQLLWRMDFSDDEPSLVVNSEVGDWKSFAVQPVFQALVLPEVVRQITLWLLSHSEQIEDSEESALSSWAQLLSSFGFDVSNVSPDDHDEWANDFVQMFCRRHRFRDSIPELTGEREG